MAVTKIQELKRLVQEALDSPEFQSSAVGLNAAPLREAVVRLLKKRRVGVTLISLAPADSAALADYGVVWKSTVSGKAETNWFSLKRSTRS